MREAFRLMMAFIRRHLATPAMRVSLHLAGIIVLLATLTRLVIAARLESTGWTRDPAGILTAMGAGLVADTGMALLLIAPGGLLLALAARRGLRTLAHVALAGGVVLLVFGAVAECFFWEEFASRLNGIAVFYLLYPREVLGNLHESFDLALWLPPIVAAGVWIAWMQRAALHEALNPRERRGLWLNAALTGVSSAVLGAALLQAAPYGWSANRELNQLALNGAASMLAAALTNNSQYDGVYPGIAEQRALPLLRALVAQDNTTFLDPAGQRSIRRWVDNGTQPKRLNVVIVLEESFGSRFVDVLDNRLPQTITPKIDRLSGQSLFFTNVYASGQRTVRGLEAVLTGFTPIPGISTARRAGSQGMHSLPFVLERYGYATAMLYGGRAQFDNMGNF